MFAGCAGGSQGTAEGGETTGTETSGETIKIGTIYAMSGEKAAIGENILRGIDFAVEEINKQGGINGRMLEVVRGDHAGDAATGRSEAERLITQEHVDVMMGCHMSTVTEVVAQVCQQYGVPMITAISTLDKLSDEEHAAYDYFFRLCPLNSIYVEDMLKYLKDSSQQTGEEIKTVAIFTDKAAIGQELIRCVNLFADQYGLEVVGEVDYSGGAADLSAQVLALKQLNPDAILCDSYVNDAVLFVNTLKEQNYKPKMIVAKANGFTDPSFITQLGSAANGVASVVEFNSDLTNGAEINKEFKEVYGRSGMTGARQKEIGIHALRGGTEAGEHTVYFFGNSERISITHHADSRMIFVSGAIKAAQFLQDRPAGMYTMRDLVFTQK